MWHQVPKNIFNGGPHPHPPSHHQSPKAHRRPTFQPPIPTHSSIHTLLSFPTYKYKENQDDADVLIVLLEFNLHKVFTSIFSQMHICSL